MSDNALNVTSNLKGSVLLSTCLRGRRSINSSGFGLLALGSREGMTNGDIDFRIICTFSGLRLSKDKRVVLCARRTMMIWIRVGGMGSKGLSVTRYRGNIGPDGADEGNHKEPGGRRNMSIFDRRISQTAIPMTW